jgi:cytochrome c oxidase subunit 2
VRKRLAILATVVIGGVLLAGCQLPTFGARAPITKQGEDSIKLWQGFFIAGAVVFVFVFVLLVWAILRYRRRSDAIPPQRQYHTLVEVLYTAIPIVMVIILFLFTFFTENHVDTPAKQALTVNVTAFQWGWQFTYTAQPGTTMKYVKVIGVETQAPELVLPEHETVRIWLRSDDVIHGFYVPAFDFSRYAQPGVTNTLTVNLNQTGTFRGQCTQFCGLFHSLMRFRVKVVTPTQFKTWVAGTHAATSEGSISSLKHQIQAQVGGGSS